MSYVYLNGETVEEENAGISLSDIGLIRGYGVFEVIRTFNKIPFLLEDHLKRLEKSAEFMNLKIPEEKSDIKNAIEELIRKNKIENEAQIRIVLSGGRTVDGMTYDKNNPTFYIMVTEFPQLPDRYFKDGIKLITTEYQRQTPKVKTLDYARAVRLHPKVKKEEAFELLYKRDGKILEATTSNFFIVKDGTVITPREGVLLGTTRKYIINLLKESGIPFEERDVEIKEIKEADEAFITATNKDVMPVCKVDGLEISKVPGKITRKIIDLFYKNALLDVSPPGVEPRSRD
ncbi:MAG: aminotransferase class IV [Candidatus Paceibacterota bacterium]